MEGKDGWMVFFGMFQKIVYISADWNAGKGGREGREGKEGKEYSPLSFLYPPSIPSFPYNNVN